MKSSLHNQYKKCTLCARKCNVDRTKGELGFCEASAEVVVASYMVHRFEEPPISGKNGSGTIFFSYCTARCSYCQNYNYSRGKHGRATTIQRLAEIMLELVKKGSHNINLVTPTHYIPTILSALDIAKSEGLSVPIVYNTNGYESDGALEMLNGYVDIYMPDAKYSDNKLAEEQCGFIDYSKYNMSALKRMRQQVGDLETDKGGIAKKGLLIRHLVIPGYIENTKSLLEKISEEISNKVHISLMNQYSPIAQVREHPNLKRRLDVEEYEESKAYLERLGFLNGWIQN